jgi:hypothetical protein
VLTQTQVKYCSNACKQKAHYNRHVKDNPNTTYSQFKRGYERKMELMNTIGTCSCSKCGYNKNLAALQFHHLDNKEFSLDIRHIANSSMSRLLEEAAKCIVLCANCHAELHNPHLEIGNQPPVEQVVEP